MQQISVELVKEATLRVLRWLAPREFRWEIQEAGSTVMIDIYHLNEVVGRFNIQPGIEGSVDRRMNWFDHDKYKLRSFIINHVENELEQLLLSQTVVEANTIERETERLIDDALDTESAPLQLAQRAQEFGIRQFRLRRWEQILVMARAGYTQNQIAEAKDVSIDTIKRDFRDMREHGLMD